MKMISKLHLFVFSVALSQHLSEIHLNSPLHVCEVTVLARNCLTSILDYIVMQMRKTNREKGYWSRVTSAEELGTMSKNNLQLPLGFTLLR